MNIQQDIKLKLRSFDHRVLDSATKQIVGIVKRTGATVKGPIPLPRKDERFTVNRSPHVDKESRDQYEIRNHARLMIITTTPQTIDALMKLDLSSEVDVEIKVIGEEE
jgi:small subunit ribosomal protein S10